MLGANQTDGGSCSDPSKAAAWDPHKPSELLSPLHVAFLQREGSRYVDFTPRLLSTRPSRCPAPGASAECRHRGKTCGSPQCPHLEGHLLPQVAAAAPVQLRPWGVVLGGKDELEGASVCQALGEGSSSHVSCSGARWFGMGGQEGQAPPPGLPPTPVPVPSADRHQRPSPGYKGSWVSRERLNKGHHNCPWRPVATPSVTELGSVGLPNWRFHLTSISICPVLKAGSTHCVLRQEQRAVPRPPPPPQARGIRCHWGGGAGGGALFPET